MIRRDESGLPYTVVDWMEFYRLRRKGAVSLVGAKKLLSDLEARDTGMLTCKYFTLFTSSFSHFSLFTYFVCSFFLMILFSNEALARGRTFITQPSIW